MKNPHRERMRLAAVHYHRHKRNTNFEQGIVAPYVFENNDPQRLTWWTDVIFILNHYRVMLAWVHPRYVYDERIYEEAGRRMAHLEFAAPTTTPITEKRGRSRKKTVGSQIHPSNEEDVAVWKAHIAGLQRNADFRITPYMKSIWTPSCRLVELCVPVEVRTREDLLTLVQFARRLLKREISIEEAFPAYVYTQATRRMESEA